jgi:retron-type reverse transcriptase
MKRLAIKLEQLADRQNLLLATWKATRGKRHRPAVARWLDGLDDNLANLSASILQGHAPVGGLRRFTIQDPKPRTIGAHGLADRVLHHAIVNLAEPRFEQMLVPSSYACRPCLGLHAAVAAAQRHLQRHAWWLQVDVAFYLAHIDHSLLRHLLRGVLFRQRAWAALECPP